MAFSYKMSQQPGAITRVMCCKDEERQRYNQQLLNLMPTHVAPSFAIRNEDNYAAYNKPGMLIHACPPARLSGAAAPSSVWLVKS
jgi:hypothetical protein